MIPAAGWCSGFRRYDNTNRCTIRKILGQSELLGHTTTGMLRDPR